MEDGTCFVVQYANMSFDHPTLPMSAGSDGLSFEIRLCQDTWRRTSSPGKQAKPAKWRI